MVHKEIYKSAKLRDNHYHLHNQNLFLKIYIKTHDRRNFNHSKNFLKHSIFTVHDSPPSFADQSNSSLHLNLSQASNTSTRTKYDLPGRRHCPFIPPSSPGNKFYPKKLNRIKLLKETVSSCSYKFWGNIYNIFLFI